MPMNPKFKSNAKRIGGGLLDGLVAIADASTITRMREIDEKLDELFQERRALNAKLDASRKFEYEPKDD